MNQIALFQETKRQTSHELRNIRTWSLVVQSEILAIFRAHPGEWLESCAFRKIGMRHDIQSHIGHVLCRMGRDGKIASKNVYFGDEHPGGKNYLGFKTVFMLGQK